MRWWLRAGRGLFAAALAWGAGSGSARPGTNETPERSTPPPLVAPTLSEGSLLIRAVPHVLQKPDFCGEACVAMWLGHLNHGGTQDWVYGQGEADPHLGRGLVTAELAKACQRIGFETGAVWTRIETAKAAEGLSAVWEALTADLAAGVPSIVCLTRSDGERSAEHFLLVLGYDAEKDSVLYHDPAIDKARYLPMARKDFFAAWPLRYSEREWTLVRIRLAGAELSPYRAPESYTAADYAQHLRRLRGKVPEGFTLLIEPPFVVLGDESSRVVKERAEKTVRWAVRLLKKDFFTRDPDAILDIWLFRDKKSYLAHAKLLFDDTPSTPYGYYSSRHGALVMNIATGGGTLVHEIVHPFVAANFPNCPAWFNEGLGSLYEACREADGEIRGLPNWRLSALQKAIAAKACPPLVQLLNTTTTEFYGENAGMNYAQARYLCYYLQEHGLLRRYYHAFRVKAKEDPAGLETLEAVLGIGELADWQPEWEAWVGRIRFDPER